MPPPARLPKIFLTKPVSPDFYAGKSDFENFKIGRTHLPPPTIMKGLGCSAQYYLFKAKSFKLAKNMPTAKSRR